MLNSTTSIGKLSGWWTCTPLIDRPCTNKLSSTNATGTWIYGNPIYTAPSRNWAFDTDFLDPANLPPGTPNVYAIHVIGWNRS